MGVIFLGLVLVFAVRHEVWGGGGGGCGCA